MTEFIKSFSENSTYALIMGIGFLFIVFIREYYRFIVKIRGIQSKTIIAQNEKVKQPNQDKKPKEVVNSNFQILERYYDQHLIEFRIMSRASLVIAILGFLVILIGVGFVLTGQTSIGTITSLGGVIAEGATVLFFRQNTALMKQIEEYHKKLISTQYLLTTVSLSESLDSDDRTSETKKIIHNLLHLSNHLHNSDLPVFKEIDTVSKKATMEKLLTNDKLNKQPKV